MKSCAFCNLSNPSSRMTEHYRLLDDSENYFVILSKVPKVTGHTLVVSKQHFSDITEVDERCLADLSAAVARWARILKAKLGCEKVYLMSMCDHWDSSELPPGTIETTEHFHVHLLPRHKEDRSWRGEVYFLRPERNTPIDELKRVKELLLDC